MSSSGRAGFAGAAVCNDRSTRSKVGRSAVTDRYEEGMRIRREVHGDEHVDAALEAATADTAEFQNLLTRYAWGEIWARPGLDRRMRSAVTLMALVALNREPELALHIRSALRNGLTREEIKEVLLQSAIYCGVPAANGAFKVFREVMEEET
jgi:4-carboxymuconolactone decarboxylase